MRIPFRQGLVRVPANFLQLAAGKVSLVLGPSDSVVATFADGAANYLTTERLSVSNAWVVHSRPATTTGCTSISTQ